MKHVELFAGIGGFRKALQLLEYDYGIKEETIAFSEKDQYATKTYKANYDTTSSIEIGDIISFTADKEKLKSLPSFDLLTGGFPCQAFSMMGLQKGFEDERGNLFFNILKIIEAKHPKFILLENVKNLVKHDKGNTFSTIKALLGKSGYNVQYAILNSANFGIPQTRNRIYIYASRKDITINFEFTNQEIRKAFREIMTSSLQKYDSTHQILDKQVEAKYFLSTKVKPTILSSGTGGYRSKISVNNLIAKPLTATMAKMHRASQDNYFTPNFINSSDPKDPKYHTYTYEELIAMPLRKLTPKEALQLQGFDTVFFNNAKEANISDAQLYKQAGNAVTVNTIYAIFYFLFYKNNLQ